MQNRVIEIHDSAVDKISLEGDMAVLHFPEFTFTPQKDAPRLTLERAGLKRL